MGKPNQIYGRWVRILVNPDNDKEIYLVLQKDKAMDIKYMKQFDNMFMGKDVILTIIELIRNKNAKESVKVEEKEKPRKGKAKDDEGEPDVPEALRHSPFWEVS